MVGVRKWVYRGVVYADLRITRAVAPILLKNHTKESLFQILRK